VGCSVYTEFELLRNAKTVAYFEALCHVIGGADEEHQDDWVSGRDWNSGPLEFVTGMPP
jgi:hypothetical protein